MMAGRFTIDAHGWCTGARREPSPNCDVRPEGVAIDLLVIHNISLPPGQFGGGEIAALFTNRLDCDAHPYFDQLRTLRVSAHFLIRRDGEVIQFVSCDERAWHAGVSSHRGRERCNDFSIGIELEGTDFAPFEAAQYEALADLTQTLRKRYPLTDVAGHEHIAPGRKTDPGPHFDWQRYARLLVAQTPSAANPHPLCFPEKSTGLL
jgi:AmpD protein